MRLAVLDADTLGADVDLSPLRARCDVSVYASTSPELVRERLATADVAVVNKIRLNASNLSGTPVRLICVAATGYDNINLDDCSAAGIAVCNVPGYSTDSVAQITLAMVLSLVNHLPEYTRFVRDGSYSASGVANRLTPVYHEFSSFTWGVVGGGGIGSKVAEIASAIGCRVLMCRRTPDTRYENADIDRLCRESDVISLHVPLTDQTRGMIGESRLSSMKDGAILVNVARGAVTDEAAVARAVKSGKLGGFGCDVYSVEPFPSDHPFAGIADLPNVCLTPHMAWGSVESRNRCVAVMGENIRSFSEGGRKNRIV